MVFLVCHSKSYVHICSCTCERVSSQKLKARRILLPVFFRPLAQLASNPGCLVREGDPALSYIASAISVRSNSSGAERNVSLSKSNPSTIACFAHQWGTACKRIFFSSSLGIFLDLSDPGNLGVVLFNSCSLAVKCLSLPLLSCESISQKEIF